VAKSGSFLVGLTLWETDRALSAETLGRINGETRSAQSRHGRDQRYDAANDRAAVGQRHSPFDRAGTNRLQLVQ